MIGVQGNGLYGFSEDGGAVIFCKELKHTNDGDPEPMAHAFESERPSLCKRPHGSAHSFLGRSNMAADQYVLKDNADCRPWSLRSQCQSQQQRQPGQGVGKRWGAGVAWERSRLQEGKAARMRSATVTLASSIISSTIWFASRICTAMPS